jgi:8-oxo-dGTP diphosphatase
MGERTDLVIAAVVIHEGRLLLVHHAKLGRWLPPGGHIERDETPDEAVLREVREETGLDVELVQREEVAGDGCDGILRELALPFYANVHHVGDHDHACLFYLCRAGNDRVRISHEITGHRWVTPGELAEAGDIPEDVKRIGKLAFRKAGVE